MASGGQIALWIFIIFIIIIIIVVIVAFAVPNNKGTVRVVPIRGTCTNDSQCDPGLVCSNGVCLTPIGGTCSLLSDCVGSATACFSGRCVNTPLSGPGGSPPCQSGLIVQNGVCTSPSNGRCTDNSDCTNGLKCIEGICQQKSRRL